MKSFLKKRGKIYICRFKNGKVYIGQTQEEMEERIRKHLLKAFGKERKNTKFCNALRKYYPDVTWELLEDNLDSNNQDLIDTREKFWIKFYDSVRLGYNTDLGGHAGNKLYLLDNQIWDIYNLLMQGEISFKLIADKYNISEGTIYKINRGKSFKIREDSFYPVRKTFDKTNSEKQLEIAQYLQYNQNEFSYSKIGKLFEVSYSTVKNINLGNYINRDFFYERGINKFPIQDNRNELIKENSNNIVKDILFSNLFFKDIAKKYQVSSDLITKISSGGGSYKATYSKLIFPLRKNKDVNQTLFYEDYSNN